MSQNRTWRNVKLTGQHHFPYFGLWVIISGMIMLAANVLLFICIHDRFMEDDSKWPFYLLIGLLIEYFLFLSGMVALAKLTAHRIAGSFLQFEKTFDAIRQGDRTARLKFRQYDNLDHVAKSFNDMMDTLDQPKRGA